MKNIHIIPTPKLSRLRYNLSNVLVFTKELYRDYGKEANQNIYITNSEEIKKGDWVFNEISKEVYKITNVDELVIYEKRVILTTDQDLIKDGVQAIDDEFLEWFVRNPSCESVEVDDCDRILLKVSTSKYIGDRAIPIKKRYPNGVIIEPKE